MRHGSADAGAELAKGDNAVAGGSPRLRQSSGLTFPGSASSRALVVTISVQDSLRDFSARQHARHWCPANLSNGGGLLHFSANRPDSSTSAGNERHRTAKPDRTYEKLRSGNIMPQVWRSRHADHLLHHAARCDLQSPDLHRGAHGAAQARASTASRIRRAGSLTPN
jgi:hypothetical protein